ncbi:MAG: class I SAM-dependent methyltransferase [Lewinellaceae bacterium]|nr:class I SAM-dependent methyltransferase [Lewinellaceae bacterium]
MNTLLKYLTRPPKGLHRRTFIAQETYAYGLLAHLFPEDRYLPVSSSSIPLSTLATICNDVVVNGRKTVVEFGSGISTIILASLFQKNKIEGKIISIDHDAGWLGILKSLAEAMGTSAYIHFVHAPLAPSKLALNGLDWYDIQSSAIEKLLGGTRVDALLVDGPYAYKKALRLARYPALPFIEPFLAENCSILLDDTNRRGEKQILKRWAGDYRLSFRSINGFSSVAFRGEHWNVFL